ncbi:hypothetical protein AGR1B_pTi0217 [Agrobacterium fabacearum S56]|nr:hypothetical protein SY94_6094 [Agrobacterium tumefaciens]CUX06625.1 hypothetical protein AGR1B_pTi0217 [Agrobacterium fabacearum S56]
MLAEFATHLPFGNPLETADNLTNFSARKSPSAGAV